MPNHAAETEMAVREELLTFMPDRLLDRRPGGSGFGARRLLASEIERADSAFFPPGFMPASVMIAFSCAANSILLAADGFTCQPVTR